MPAEARGLGAQPAPAKKAPAKKAPAKKRGRGPPRGHAARRRPRQRTVRKVRGRQADRAQGAPAAQDGHAASRRRVQAARMKLLVFAVGQRQPAWADAACADFAKRFPPELRLELKAVKAEPRSARRRRRSAWPPRRSASRPRCRRARAASCSTSTARAVTTAQLAERLRAWRGDGRDVALLIGGPDGLDAGAEGQRRRDAAPVGPDAAACLRARAAGRGAVPRLVADCKATPTTANERTRRATTSSTSPRRARAARSCCSRSACATSCCCPTPTRTPRRWRPCAPASCRPPTCERVTRAKLRGRAARACRGAARRRRRSCAPTPRWRSAGASSASRPTRPRRARMLRALSGRTHRVLTAVAVHDGRARRMLR